MDRMMNIYMKTIEEILLPKDKRLNLEMEEERLSGLQDQQEDKRICACGEMLDECPDAYAHITSGA